MKTKLVPWWENPLRFIVQTMVFLIFIAIIVYGLGYILEMGDVDTIFGEMNEATLSFIVLSVVFIPVLLVMFFAPNLGVTFRRPLFKYEKNKNLVPYLNNRTCFYVEKTHVNKYDWRESKRFEKLIFPKETTNNNMVICEDIDGNTYLVRQKHFIDNVDMVIKLGGIQGVWKHVWTTWNFVELVLIKV